MNTGIPQAIREIRRVEQEKTMSFLGVGINTEAANALRTLSVRAPIELKDLKYEAIFRWVSQHVINVSVNGVGEDFDTDEILDAEWRKF